MSSIGVAGSQSTTKSHRTLHKLSTECRTAISNLRNPERNIRSVVDARQAKS